MPEDKILVTIPENKDNNKITVDLRFIIMSSAWKVTVIDNSKIGLITLLCDKSQFDTVNHDMENEIADAHKYIHTYTISITNGDSADLDYRETNLQLSVSCTDNGAVVENPIVTYSSDNEIVATIDNNGLVTCHALGQAVITATYNDIFDSLIMNDIEVVTDNYSIEYVNPFTSIYQGQAELADEECYIYCWYTPPENHFLGDHLFIIWGMYFIVKIELETVVISTEKEESSTL